MTGGDAILRPVTEDDAFMLARWRNEPDVREQSFDSGFIPLDRHLAWLRATLESPATRMYVLQLADGPGGYIRFTIDSNRAAEASVVVAPGLRGRGVGRMLIALGSARVEDELGVRQIEARIKPGNAASIAAFKAAGYAERADEPDGTVVLTRRATG